MANGTDVTGVAAFSLATEDGRVGGLDALLERDAPVLLVFAERDCPTSRGAVAALADCGGNLAVVSQGRPEAARDLIAATGIPGSQVLIERAPYATSSDYAIQTVPTFVLVDADRHEVERAEGWDRDRVAKLVAAAGGALRDNAMPEHKPGCQSRSTYDHDMQAQLERDDAELPTSGDGGVEEMWRRGWHDGLPVVPPTRDRVRAMLDGLDGSQVLGEVGPTLGALTLERLASCAVLAGCEPAYFPVVRAAAEAILDDGFNVHGLQNTTHFASPAIIVNGPVRTALGMAAGSNAMGPGNRANATIGRAIRLVMSLTGGGTPGGLDQSTLGGPHKIGYCFPENEEASPWEPLHVSLGYDADVSTVTVLAGEPPAGVSDHYSQTAEQLATSLTTALEGTWNRSWYPLGAHTVLVVCPEHAATLAEAGWSKADLRAFIFAHARATAGELKARGTGELTPFVTHAESDDTVIPKFLSEDEIVIVVAGGDAGRFSAVIGPWVGFGLGSTMITREVHP